MSDDEARSVTLELKGPDDYRTIQDVIARAGLRPQHEEWLEWRPCSPRRITLAFETAEDGDFARLALSEFLP